MGQLVEANGASDQAFLVSLFSVGNCAGRAVLGMASDALVARGVMSGWVFRHLSLPTEWWPTTHASR